jgi:hypothetical protein
MGNCRNVKLKYSATMLTNITYFTDYWRSRILSYTIVTLLQQRSSKKVMFLNSVIQTRGVNIHPLNNKHYTSTVDQMCIKQQLSTDESSVNVIIKAQF